MQDHPIDIVRDQLAEVAAGLGQGVIGLLTGLALIGVLWLSALHPALAAGSSMGPDVSAAGQAHVGVAGYALNGQAAATSGVVATSLSVCRLVLDPVEPAPSTCVPVLGVSLQD